MPDHAFPPLPLPTRSPVSSQYCRPASLGKYSCVRLACGSRLATRRRTKRPEITKPADHVKREASGRACLPRLLPAGRRPAVRPSAFCAPLSLCLALACLPHKLFDPFPINTPHTTRLFSLLNSFLSPSAGTTDRADLASRRRRDPFFTTRSPRRPPLHPRTLHTPAHDPSVRICTPYQTDTSR